MNAGDLAIVNLEYSGGQIAVKTESFRFRCSCSSPPTDLRIFVQGIRTVAAACEKVFLTSSNSTS